jgi:malate synthase
MQGEISADKKGEISRGTLTRAWAASPFMAPVVAEVFWDAQKKGRLQFHESFKNHSVTAVDLLNYPNVQEYPLTREEFFDTVLAALEYMGPWLNDLGCVAPRGAMEDMATAEISRSLIWQWIHKGVYLHNHESEPVDFALLQMAIDNSLEVLRKRWIKPDGSEIENDRGIPLNSYFQRAARLLFEAMQQEEPVDFLSTVMVPEVLADLDPAAKLRYDFLN